jgi:hypothetical protein
MQAGSPGSGKACVEMQVGKAADRLVDVELDAATETTALISTAL